MRFLGQSRTKSKYPGPVAAGVFFSITAILLTYGGYLLKPFGNNYLKSGMGELLFVLLPVVVFLIAGGYNVRDTLKLNRTRPVNYLIVVFLMIFGLPVVGVLNAIVMLIIRLSFGRNLSVPRLDISDLPTLAVAILVVGISAAVCEEIMFRGLISKGYEKLGVTGSLILTSVLFGILHRDIQKGVGVILLGGLIGFIVYRTKSIYIGMVAHFTNNTIAVLLTYAAANLNKRMDSMGIDQVEKLDLSNIPMASLVIVAIFYALLFLGSLACFIALFYALIKSTDVNFKGPAGQIPLTNKPLPDSSLPYSAEGAENDVNNAALQQKGFGFAALLSLLPGVLLILFIFTRQILLLMNIKSGWIYTFLQAIGLA